MRLRVILLCLVICRTLGAQIPASSIQGEVKDPSGAVMVGVTVVVTNVRTGVHYTAQSNHAGEYLATYLLPGDYRVMAEAPGFKRFLREGITLQMDQKARIDIELAVGSASETVRVEAAAPLLESEQSALGQVVNLTQVRDLPLLGRNPMSLVTLVPGVFNQPGAAFSSISGGRAMASAVLLDGVGNNDMQPMHTPSVDAVQEFKVYTHAFSAEYGRTGGGVVSLSIKSGTNQVHGNLFEFFRNDRLDARNFFTLPSAKKPVLRYNQFGGTLGGPVRIPRVFDGRNKLFFFTSYQETRQSSGGASVYTVPTPLQSQGIFTEAGQLPIYDPATTRPAPGTAGGFVRDPLPGNSVPRARIDPVAAKLMALFPPQNTTGLLNNYVSSAIGRLSPNLTSDSRIDYRVSDGDSLMFRYSHGDMVQHTAKGLPGLADRSGGDTVNHDRNATLQEVHTFSPRLINEFRTSISRLREWHIPLGWFGTYGTNYAATFGIPNFPALQMPIFNISGTAGLGPTRPPLNQNKQHFYIVDAVTYVRGRHIIKSGTDTVWSQERRFQPNGGTFGFDAAFTSQPGVARSGIGMASFLLGLPINASVSVTQFAQNYRAQSSALYLQDDWKAAPSLTLNLGVRFDGLLGLTEINDQISNFNLQTGAVERVGRDGRPRSPFDFNMKFAPRIGFAWQPRFLRATALRGGYGIFSSSMDRYNQPQSYPWVNNISLTSPDNLTAPFVLSQGPAPGAFSSERLTIEGGSMNNIQRRNWVDYIQNWQFSVQRELLAQKLLLDVAYGGSKGTHLQSGQGLNQVPRDKMGPGNAQALRPYPNLQGVSSRGGGGSSIYHSLQLKVEGRLGAKGNFLVSYTYSRSISDLGGDVWQGGVAVGTQDAYDLRAERSISGFNFPQRLVANYTYPLPFGRGRQFLNSGEWAGLLFGGWGFSGVTVMQTGGPVAMGITPNTTNAFSGLRPNRIKDGRLSSSERSLQRYFDTSAFTAPPPYAFGNSEKYLLMEPGIVNFDLSVARRMNLRRGDTQRFFEFRSEFFSSLNTPQFNSPNTTLGSPQFGMINSARGGRVIQFALKFYF